MIVLISGSRHFCDYVLFSQILDLVLIPNPFFIFGDCKGADSLAKRYADERKICYEIYRADWKKGLSAGPIRNKKMINIGHPDIGIFFISKESKGTKQCLGYAKMKKIKCIKIPVS